MSLLLFVKNKYETMLGFHSLFIKITIHSDTWVLVWARGSCPNVKTNSVQGNASVTDALPWTEFQYNDGRSVIILKLPLF